MAVKTVKKGIHKDNPEKVKQDMKKAVSNYLESLNEHLKDLRLSAYFSDVFYTVDNAVLNKVMVKSKSIIGFTSHYCFAFYISYESGVLKVYDTELGELNYNVPGLSVHIYKITGRGSFKILENFGNLVEGDREVPSSLGDSVDTRSREEKNREFEDLVGKLIGESLRVDDSKAESDSKVRQSNYFSIKEII